MRNLGIGILGFAMVRFFTQALFHLVDGSAAIDLALPQLLATLSVASLLVHLTRNRGDRP